MADKVIINVRERPLSTDIMLLQQMGQRVEADFKKHYLASQHGVGGNELINTFPEALVGGLILGGVSSTVLSIGPGFITQDSASLAPTPGSNDSTYRIGLNKTTTNVTLPVPGGTFFTPYILRGQVQEVSTVTEPRDIMNALTAQFESVNVAKVKEWRISFSFQAGSVDNPVMPAPAADYVPLYLVSVASDGTLLGAVDLRHTADKRPPGTRRQNWGRQQRSQIKTINSGPAFVSEGAQVIVSDAITNQDSATGTTGGLHMRLMPRSTSVVSFSPISYLCAGAVVTAGAWIYLYMLPWYDLAPCATLTDMDTCGIFGASHVPPTLGYNSAALVAPAGGTFAGYTVPVGVAPCVGVMKRAPDLGASPGNNGWAMMRMKDGVYQFYSDAQKSNRLVSDTAAASTKIYELTAASHIPDVFTEVTLKIHGTIAPTSGTNIGTSCGYTGDEAYGPIDYNIFSIPANAAPSSFESVLRAPWKPGTNLKVFLGAAVNFLGVEIELIGASTSF